MWSPDARSFLKFYIHLMAEHLVEMQILMSRLGSVAAVIRTLILKDGHSGGH